MRSIARFLPCLALIGCGGSVTLEDVDPFGSVWSAVWFKTDVSGGDDSHGITLSNVIGLCGKQRAAQEAFDEAQDELEDLDIDDSDYCEEAREPVMNWARAARALEFEGAHYMNLAVFTDGSTEPEEETYEVGDDEAALFGTVFYYEESPWDAIIEDWDVDGDGEDNCGVDDDAFEIDTDAWAVSEGELELETVEDEQFLTGTLDAELVDDDGDEAGEIQSKFTASYCEVEDQD